MDYNKKVEYINRVKEDFVKKGLVKFKTSPLVNEEVLVKLFGDSKFYEHEIESKDFSIDKDVSYYSEGLLEEVSHEKLDDLENYV